jgi:hypothetical protein
VLHIPLATAAALLAHSASSSPSAGPTIYNQTIAREAKIHGVPEAFVQRIVMRASSGRRTFAAGNRLSSQTAG